MTDPLKILLLLPFCIILDVSVLGPLMDSTFIVVDAAPLDGASRVLMNGLKGIMSLPSTTLDLLTTAATMIAQLVRSY